MKICPLCNTELSENLWCWRCQRKVILYKNVERPEKNMDQDDFSGSSGYYNDSYDNNSPNNERPEASPSYRTETPDVAPMSRVERNYYENKGTLQSESNIRPDNGSNSKTQYANFDRKPSSKIGKIVIFNLISSLAVIIIIAIVATMNYKITANKKNAQKTAKQISDSIVLPNYDVSEIMEKQKEILEQSENLRAVAESLEAERKERLEQLKEESAALSAGITSQCIDFCDVHQLFTPIGSDTYGDNTFYYYSASDLSGLPYQCDYYHMDCTKDTIASFLNAEMGEALYNVETSQDAYGNYYQQGTNGHFSLLQESTVFQSLPLDITLNYDTASHNLHVIYLSSQDSRDSVLMLHKLLPLLSPEYNFSEDELQLLIDTALEQAADATTTEEIGFLYLDSKVAVYLSRNSYMYYYQITPIEYANAYMIGTYDLGHYN